MRVCQLLALLQQAPANAVVATWDTYLEVDNDVEAVHLVAGPSGPVLVLGLDMAGLGESEVIWMEKAS
jgi:hypothetical protein